MIKSGAINSSKLHKEKNGALKLCWEVVFLNQILRRRSFHASTIVKFHWTHLFTR